MKDNKKYLPLLIPIVLIILIITAPEQLNWGTLIPFIGVLLVQLPHILKLLLPSYETINHFKTFNKIFDYSGKGLIIFAALRLVFKIYMKG